MSTHTDRPSPQALSAEEVADLIARCQDGDQDACARLDAAGIEPPELEVEVQPLAQHTFRVDASDPLRTWASDGEVPYQVFRFHDAGTITGEMCLEFVRNVWPRFEDGMNQDALVTAGVEAALSELPAGRYVAIASLGRVDFTVSSSIAITDRAAS